MRLHIDIETKSPIDLVKCGVYRYAEEATVVVAAWSLDDSPVYVWHAGTGEDVPDALLALLRDPAIVKHAFNANFERTLLKACWGIDCPPESWRCTQVLCYTNGLPGSLAEAALALNLTDQKDALGKKLIRLFSLPQKPTKRQPKVWLDPIDRPDEWLQFVRYCQQDVVVERAIHHKLRHFDLPATEWALWAMDQRANDLGIGLDRRLVEQAIAIDEHATAGLIEEAARLTGLDNPNSVAQL